MIGEVVVPEMLLVKSLQHSGLSSNNYIDFDPWVSKTIKFFFYFDYKIVVKLY